MKKTAFWLLRTAPSRAPMMCPSGPHHEVSAFEFGLDLILDGLKRAL